MARRSLIGAVAAVLITACGAGDDVDPSEAAQTPIGRAITDDLLSTSPALTESEATCVSGRIVAGIGEAELESMGVSGESIARLGEATLSGDQIEAIVEAWSACIDIRAQAARSLSVEIGDDAAACLSDGIDLDLAKELLAASLGGTFDLSDSAVARVAVIAAGCGILIG